MAMRYTLTLEDTDFPKLFDIDEFGGLRFLRSEIVDIEEMCYSGMSFEITVLAETGEAISELVEASGINVLEIEAIDD